jgi:exodeoxyribonuclease V alpha subunit
MEGFAQKLFYLKEETTVGEPLSTQPKWPFLNQIKTSNGLPYIDYALAHYLLKGSPNGQEAVACFLCHLSMASRNGHLCIHIDDRDVFPEPSLLWQPLNDSTCPALSEEDMKKLKAMIMEGAYQLSDHLVTDVSLNGSPATPLCRKENLFYFHRYWSYEKEFLKYFNLLKGSKPSIECDFRRVYAQTQTFLNEKKLLQEQADVIIAACKNCLTLICGGPGTGKTYTAAYLIQTFWDSLSDPQKQQCEIALAAPTGKAASNLQKSLNRLLTSIENFKPVKAKTLHSLLGIKRTKSFYKDENTCLTADLILVDESSMIDVKMMVSLLAAIKPGARLILLGDQHQLPPVESGGLFADMIRSSESTSSTSFKPVLLKTCLRAELKEIVEFANEVNCGEASKAVNRLIHPKESSGIVRLQLNETTVKGQLKSLVEQAAKLYEYPQEIHSSPPERWLEIFNSFRVLSPLRKGPFGVDEINAKIYSSLANKYKKYEKFFVPIMILSNDNRLELFNGEVGVLVKFNSTENTQNLNRKDFAIFPGNAEIPYRKLPAVLLPQFEYAYCLSVHKSQGSEFDHVLLLLPEGSEIFGREVLYTGITRARKKIELYCSEDTFTKTLQRQTRRLSGVVSAC